MIGICNGMPLILYPINCVVKMERKGGGGREREVEVRVGRGGGERAVEVRVGRGGGEREVEVRRRREEDKWRKKLTMIVNVHLPLFSGSSGFGSWRRKKHTASITNITGVLKTALEQGQ